MSEKNPNSQEKKKVISDQDKDAGRVLEGRNVESDSQVVPESLDYDGSNANSKQEWAREATEVAEGSQENRKRKKDQKDNPPRPL